MASSTTQPDLLQRIITFPVRAYRERISLQLIVSNVLVVLLTVLLVELALIALILFVVGLPFGPNVINEQMGWQAEQAAQRLAETEAARSLRDGELTDAEHAELTVTLEQYVDQGVPMAPDSSPWPVGANARALIVNSEGEIVASTSPRWGERGEDFRQIDFAPAINVVNRALELAGGRTGYGNTYVLDYDDGSILDFDFDFDFSEGTMAAAHPLMVDGRFAGVVLLQGDIDISSSPGETTVIGLILLAIGNTVALTLIAIPALIVAIPIGVIRARRLSGRLSRLADTADAMARGDLSQRVEVRGHDEVANVSQRFNEMAARLEEADRARRAFVSNVSHELRTPVAIIQGNLEQLLARAASERDPETLEAMHRETVTLSRLIDDLFTLARIEEAALELEPVAVNVGETVRQAAEGIRALAWEQRRVSVETMIPTGLPQALADNVRLLQIMNNLLYNALRHTPEGGLIVVSAAQSGEEVEVAVADTGIGIPPEEIERIFDRFHQVERSGRHHDGSGLGLAIVRQLVEAMDGRITVESDPEQGTTFRFTLPVAG